MSDAVSSKLSPEKQTLLALRKMRAKLEELERLRSEPIAVIGVGCRFPGEAASPEALWQLLRGGFDAITEVPPDRWDIDAFYDPDPDAAGKMQTRHGGFLRHIDEFDPQFFGIAPREAIKMDPQQRLLLEVSWEALERAGQAPDRLTGSRTGVFVGITSSDYAELLQHGDPTDLDAYSMTGTASNFAAGRLSYLLGLQGPSMAIDTACSSSLVAVHLACQSLRAGECRMALAAGTNAILIPENSVLLSRARMLAPDGRCKSFAAAADGYVRGEGCGVVVLKRISDAVADGDPVLAVIRASAVNQDGRSSGLTVPNGPAQEALIREALAAGRVEAKEVGYVEAHGSGTPLGDPIEIRALNAALCHERSPAQPLLVGSAKTNFGHLEAAAGIAGLIKTVLAVQRGEIPPHLHFAEPNPHIAWGELPIVVPTSTMPWPPSYARRVAGVSSFGASGTNAHVIVEQADDGSVPDVEVDRPLHVIAVSAKSNEALGELAARWSRHLAAEDQTALGRVAYSANAGRAHFAHRAAVIAATTLEAREKLAAVAAGEVPAGAAKGEVAPSGSPRLAFLYTGQGSQYVGMGRQLYETQPTFRQAFDRCDVLCGLPRPLRSVLHAEAGSDSTLDETAYTQPALFALEFALTELFASWGITPAAVLGHSVGGYVAACVAGALSLEDAVKLITARGRLMQALPAGGAMAAVFADEALVRAALTPHAHVLSIAAINGPDNVVISGAADALEVVLARLRDDGVRAQRLTVSHAFHSPLMDPMLDEFGRLAGEVKYRAPRIALISDLTGELARPDEIGAEYWRRHVREPVRFASALETVYGRGHRVFVEIGPQPTLSGMGRRGLPEDTVWVPTLRKGRADWQQVLEAVGELYTRGVDVDWNGFDRDYPRRKVALPTYPFQRQRYWVTSNRPGRGASATSTEPWRKWLYELEWRNADGDSSRRDLPSPSRLAEHVAPDIEPLAAEHGLEVYEELRPELEKLCVRLVLKALADLGWDPDREPRLDVERAARRFGVIDRHARLFARMFEILGEAGILVRSGGTWEVRSAPDARSEAADLLARFPACAAEISLLQRCGAGLADVLTGRGDAMELLFPDGSLEQLERIYQDVPASRFLNSLVRQAMVSARRAVPAGRRLRVLEIGAGTGSTTAYVLPELDPQRTEYVFTDVSKGFMGRAREKFRTCSFLEYRVLDIADDPEQQGFVEGSFDVILASHVIHATPDLRRTLGNVRKLLAPGGLLVMLEVTARRPLLDLTFGLTEGWWCFGDVDLRPSHPLLSAEQWTRVLGEAGFVEPVALQSADGAGDAAMLVAAQPRIDAPAARRGEGLDSWLVLADDGGTGERFAQFVRSRGDRCIVVMKGRSFEALGDDRFAVNPERRDDYDRLLAAVLGPDRLACTRVAHFWSLDERLTADDAPEAIDAAEHRACGSVLYLVQALAESGRESQPHVAAVTRGAQAVGDAAVEPAQAMMWGLGKAIAREHPELHFTCVDLDPRDEAGGDEVKALYDDVLLADGREDQIARRRSERFVLRLVPAAASADTNGSIPPFASDGVYLITGGLGGVGLRVARGMVERGARRLLLMARSEPSDAARTAIRAMEDAGAEIEIARADVADRRAVADVLGRIAASGQRLRGVVHSAGTLDDGVLLRQNWERFRTVMAAKVHGAWNLHVLTRTSALDFFVMFSSTASLLGPPGQGNHAAVNAFLDALAHHRRACGLPGSSINWGPWSEIGAAARAGVVDRAAIHGLRAIAPDQGLMVLEHLLRTGATQVGVLPADWSRILRSAPGSWTAPMFRDLAVATDDGPAASAATAAAASPAPPALREQLNAAPVHKRREVLLAHVAEQAGLVLGLDATALPDPRQGLRDCGLDSLMALELRNRLQRSVGQPLRSTLAFDFPTIEAIAGYLAREVLALEQTPPARTASAVDSGDPADVLLKIEQLSDEQVERLLAERVMSPGGVR